MSARNPHDHRPMFFKEPLVKPQYCQKCGRMLMVLRINKRYNLNTGEAESDLFWKCPNWSWCDWRHTKFKSNEEGDTYAFES